MVAVINRNAQRIRPIRHDLTGRVIGINTDHYSGRTDALIHPPIFRPAGLLRSAAIEQADMVRHRGCVLAEKGITVSGGAITASGMACINFRDAWDATQLAINTGSDTFDGRLVLDTLAPNFSTHSVWSDWSGSEISGTGYTADGKALTGIALAVVSGSVDLDADDVSWATSTLTNAMGLAIVDTTIALDPLIGLLDFITAVSTVAGLLSVTMAAGGWFKNDLTPT